MLRQLSELFNSLQGAPGGAHRTVWNELSPWLRQLTSHAALKWLPRLSANIPCQIPVMRQGKHVGPCNGKAVAVCIVCEQSVCLGHAFVDGYGEAVCYVCIAKAANRAPADGGKTADAPPPPAPGPGPEIAWARKTLRLKRNATLEDARSAHRKLSGKYHPDRYPEAEKAEAEQKFKDVQRAWDVMQKFFEKKAA